MNVIIEHSFIFLVIVVEKRLMNIAGYWGKLTHRKPMNVIICWALKIAKDRDNEREQRGQDLRRTAFSFVPCVFFPDFLTNSVLPTWSHHLVECISVHPTRQSGNSSMSLRVFVFKNSKSSGIFCPKIGLSPSSWSQTVSDHTHSADMTRGRRSPAHKLAAHPAFVQPHPKAALTNNTHTYIHTVCVWPLKKSGWSSYWPSKFSCVLKRQFFFRKTCKIRLLGFHFLVMSSSWWGFGN